MQEQEPDIQPSLGSIRRFYLESQLGHQVRVVLVKEIRILWPDLRHYDIVGYGCAGPILSSLDARASRVVDLLPSSLVSPDCRSGLARGSVVVADQLWPLPTSFAERMLVMHGLENSPNASALLKECWRVLAPEGRIVLVVTNRAGLWARNPATPFGSGRAFTLAGIEQLLLSHRFDLTGSRATLFSPPAVFGKHAEPMKRLDRIGKMPVLRHVGGVNIVEARKRVFAKMRPGLSTAVRSGIEMLRGVGTPNPEPASGR